MRETYLNSKELKDFEDNALGFKIFIAEQDAEYSSLSEAIKEYNKTMALDNE